MEFLGGKNRRQVWRKQFLIATTQAGAIGLSGLLARVQMAICSAMPQAKIGLIGRALKMGIALEL
jgi:hypothetical protein